MGQFKVTYTTNNTFTVPPGVTEIFVECLGGGAGGGAGSTLAAGGAGGGGAYAASTLTVSPGATHSIVVGQNVAGGSGGAAGTPGQLSSFGTGPLVRAAAGTQGGAASGLSAGSHGAGGTVANSIGTTRTAGGAGSTGGGGQGAAPIGGVGNSFGDGGSGGAAITSGPGAIGNAGRVIITFDYVTDNAASSDTVNYVVSWKRSFNETASASDAFLKTILSSKEDSISTTDFITKRQFLYRDEFITPTDNIVKLFRDFNSDTVNLTDFALIVLVYIRNINDTAIVLDTIYKNTSTTKTDVASVIDFISKFVLKKPVGDSISTSDASFIQAIYNRSFNSTALTTDLLRKKMILGFEDNISGSVFIPPVSGGRKKIIVIAE